MKKKYNLTKTIRKILITFVFNIINTILKKDMNKKTINYKKVVQALVYFAEKESNKQFNKMKAYKMLWLADRYHIRQYGRSITNDKYFAMPFGTVPSKTKEMLDGKNIDDVFFDYLDIVDNNTYKAKSSANLKVFSKSDLNALDTIYNKFKNLTPFELSEYSHLFPEWKRFEENLKDSNKSNSYAVKINDFFEKTAGDDSGLFNDSDELLALTKELYNNN